MEEQDKQLLLKAVDEIRSLRKTNESMSEQLSIVHTFRALILKEKGGWMSEDIVQKIMERITAPDEKANKGAEF